MARRLQSNDWVEQAFAYSTLALTVTLAVSRPRLRGLRVTPGSAALLGVALLMAARLVGAGDLAEAARVQWRPLLSLGCIMIMTGAVKEVGAFERLAARAEAWARTTTTVRAFTLVFAGAVLVPALLNNDSAILLLTPLVVPLAQRLHPGRPRVAEAFAFAVFFAPGVAPLVVSNPMNMIVAEYAGVGFLAYARVMAPISVAGALMTYLVLRVAFRRALASPPPRGARVEMPPANAAQTPMLALLVAVFAAYPIVTRFGGAIWPVTLAGALASAAIALRQNAAPIRRLVAHVSPDILLFLWGVLVVVVGLKHVGLVERVASLYRLAPVGSARELGLIGVGSAMGSALIDNHPMALLNMMALGARGACRPILAALVGGDIGPRLLPIGSLAGLLWLELSRRAGVEIRLGRFVKIGALALVPTLALSLLLLALT